jgi:putative acyl-CoA dehydrogenase
MPTIPAPRTHLETHEVTNQPPEFVDENLYLSDKALSEAAKREGGEWVGGPLALLGDIAGSAEVLQWGAEANRHPPELATFDRYGRRIDEVRFHPSYHKLMALAMQQGIHNVAWTTEGKGGHVLHAAMLAVFTQAEAGVMCPVSMTYASVPALRHQPKLAALWEPKILRGIYDAPLRPIREKTGVTLGMAMTEKQGGSDVRANATRAFPLGEGVGGPAFRLAGHKWFCSAPMSDAFLTLAYTEKGLSCFLVPRILPDGARNAFHLMRLKDKLGNRSNASAEIEYHDTYAELVGEEGRGVATIIEMVHHTRLDTCANALGLMRRALAEAVNHVNHRRVFQKKLIDQPLMRAVLADLALDYEAGAALVMRVARAFEGETPAERAFARLAVALAKFWLAKRAPQFVCECLECLGGGGYIEEGPMARLYREAPLNAIWEGSGNVIALDILRTLAREPLARAALMAEMRAAKGGNARLDAAAEALGGIINGPVGEVDARRIAERLALVLQAALLVRHAPPEIADAYCAARLGDRWSANYGASEFGAGEADAILARQETF